MTLANARQIFDGMNSLIYYQDTSEYGVPVIIKVLKAEHPTPRQLVQFANEYEITRDLAIPGVRNALQQTSVEYKSALVLEYVDGETVKQVFTSTQRSLETFLTMAIQMAQALGDIHYHQIIHKDINSHNVLVNPDTNTVKIIDFGISSKLTTKIQHLGNPDTLEGTLAYISPEQTGRMNRVVDYRTDLYSLGVTFYEMLTGRLPFEADDAIGLVHCHLAKMPPPIEIIDNSQLTIDNSQFAILSDIIMRLLAKNAEDRYQSAHGVKTDLEYLFHTLTGGEIFPGFTLGRRDIVDRFQIPEKLYGREHELHTLMEAFDRVSQGARELLLVAGSSGVGKSAIVHEVHKPMTLKRGRFISGKFNQFQRNIPYLAFTQAFNQFCDVLLTESPETLAVWKKKILDAVGKNGQVLIHLIPRLELVIGQQPAVAEVGFQEMQNRFNLYVQFFMRAICGADSPLVLFIDDLQWADSASLHLLELLLTDPQSRHLLVVGAYRDNEVTAAHPLRRTLELLEKEGTTMQRIQVENLGRDDVSALLAESLQIHPERLNEFADKALTADLAALSELVYHKTLGNAFFVTQFLQSLYEDQLVTFDREQRQWVWDFHQIQARGITDNVVELMVAKIQKLSATTQESLQLAACVGNTFDLHTLRVIQERTVHETLEAMLEGIEEGLIIPLNDQYRFIIPENDRSQPEEFAVFRFVHDRVQQAAYSLIEKAQLQSVHLRIGRLLLKNIQASAREEQIFDLVYHLNLGDDLVKDAEERLRIAELNLMAAKKAKQSAAYLPALEYATMGIGFLPDESWSECYDLTLRLHEECAEAAYLSGNSAQMERVIETVLLRARTDIDRVKAYNVKIEALKAEVRLKDAINTGLHALKHLGIVFPDTPSKLHVLLALLSTKRLLAGKRPEEFINLPEMTDPVKLAAVRLILNIGSAAHFAAPTLLPLLVFKDVSLSVQYGNTPEASFNYATYAFSLCGILGKIEAGYQYSQLALQVLERFKSNTFRAKTLFMVNFFVTHWKEHAANTLQPLLEAYHIGLETGDFEYAGYGISEYIRYAFFIGKDLSILDQTIRLHYPTVHQLKQEMDLHNMAICHQAIINLNGRGEDPSRLIGEYYDEDDISIHTQHNRNIVITFYLYKLILCYLFHAYPQALEHADNGDTYVDGAKGSLSLPLFHFYASLARLAGCSEASRAERRRLFRKVTASQKKLKKWAFHAPMNHLHKWYLVEAERCRVTGKSNLARAYYDKAIQGAKAYGYINEEALAYELAGRFYLEQDVPDIARLYLRHAHAAYQRWGAWAKVNDLEKRYPDVLTTFLSSSTPPSSINSEQTPEPTDHEGKRVASHVRLASSTSTDGQTTTHLDVESVFKASRTLSGEIHLDRLLEEMIGLVIENAGAEKGSLLLSKGDEWYIEASGQVDTEQVDVLQGIPLSLSSNLSQGIIHYVIRTREPIVLRDAFNEGNFRHDDYVRTQHPKSVLCLPLLNQGKLAGILYLENNLATGVFTPERVHILTLLSSQAAISIENARLYDQLAEYNRTLEAKVAERTEELMIAREKAEAANQAKSAFLANMTHELRSPLTAILGFAQVMTRSQRLDPDNMENLGLISRSGEHLLALINQVLDLSKIEAGRMTLNPCDFNLGHLLDDVEDMFRLKAKSKGLQLLFERAPDVQLALRADELKLRQVLINLLNNALKFTKHGGITVKVIRMSDLSGLSNLSDRTLTQDRLQFSVSDTGPGIAPEELHKLFEAFEQTSSGKQSQEGTGLGLPISRKFVQLMGGDMQVESQVGTGTTFRFDIMVERLDEDQAQAVRPVTHRVLALEPGQPRYRILIVDDKAVNRLLLVKLLQPLGFDIREAENGEEAIRVWGEWEPHLIWMDMRMPVMDGYEATKKIKNEESGMNGCKIIAITASMMEEERAVTLAAGCDDFLRKPFRDQQIFDLLTKHLGVRFVYEEEMPLNRTEANMADLPAAFAQLPPDLPEQLRHAVEMCDIDLILRIIGDIRLYQPAAADVLLDRANNFEYDKILNLLA